MSIAHGLANGDDIRNDALRLKGPKVSANSSKANLHFVSYANASSGTDVGVNSLQVAFRENDLTATTDHRLADKCGHRTTCFLGRLDQLLDLVGVQLSNSIFAKLFSWELASI